MYALDIGTRNVVGVIATYEDDRLKVLQSHSMKHPQRAMYDGHHEIDAVARVTRKMTDILQDMSGYELKSVSIAAAGALLTRKTTIDRVLDPLVEISTEFFGCA